MRKGYILILIFLLLGVADMPCLEAAVKLPRLISDGMVIQRDQDIRIWGWAVSGERIEVTWNGEAKTVTANADGIWEAIFNPMPAGGPYLLTIIGDNSNCEIRDIWVGDVWVCSGQSNMKTTMERVEPLFPDEVATATNPQIRYFDVAEAYDFNEPQLDTQGGSWLEVHPANIRGFAAVPYFFAKKVFAQYGIPIGLINASVGGSPIQSWIREEELKRFPEDYSEALRFQDATLIASIEREERAQSRKWHQDLRAKDVGYKNPELPWHSEAFNPSGWSEMASLDFLLLEEGKSVNGVYWFRKVFDLQQEDVNELDGKLLLGTLVDSDSTYVNGILVGTTGYQYPPRRYTVPKGILKAGENVLTVRVINERGIGGFISEKPYQLTVGDETIELKDDWVYQLGAAMPPAPTQTFIKGKPLGLYQAMLAPIQQFPAKGVLWYQGESNAGNPERYTSQIEALISGWRDAWNRPNLPFLFVQLPNFMAPSEQPQESNWAAIREAQRQALATPNTGMAVTIDVGEANDIHPLDKKSVGDRLALRAFEVAYGEKAGTFSGPLVKEITRGGDKLMVHFTHVGSGLDIRGSEELGGFAVAGKDGVYQWVKPEIQGDTVVLDVSNFTEPLKVRYGWADNPVNANLINKEGLPASPFEVGVTK